MFEADEFLSTGDDCRRVCGLDITVAWPLPIDPPAIYEEFATRVSELDAGVYVYPLAQTHITVLTAINFKSEIDPSQSRVSFIEEAAGRLFGFLDSLATTLRPFVITIGAPVLSGRAGYLHIQNPTGEIERFRRGALQFCRELGDPFDQAQAPTIIHSTILRFRRPPADAQRFICGFHRLAEDACFGSATLDEILIALEVQPYMREGRVIRRVRLKEPSSTVANPCPHQSPTHRR
jgi:hypothetical protein